MTEPNDALARAESAFASGDHARLQEELRALPEEARRAPRARLLAGALTVDPAHVAVLLVCGALLTAIALYYW
jgi:hypothetical protein